FGWGSLRRARGFSLGPLAYPDDADGAVVELDPELPPVAAPASPAAPTARPVATAAVINHERLLRTGVGCAPVAPDAGTAPSSMGSIGTSSLWCPGVSRAPPPSAPAARPG